MLPRTLMRYNSWAITVGFADSRKHYFGISRMRTFNKLKLLLSFSILPIIFLAGANSAPSFAETKNAANGELALNRFESDIKKFEQHDKNEKVLQGGTVFVGSSTFTMWKGLEHDFAKYKAINRGFGGSTLPDINHYVSRIVCKYKPSKIVLYGGTNDIAELKHSGKQVADDFKEFVAKVRMELPNAEIYFVSMSMAPSRIQWKEQYDDGNKLVHQFIKQEMQLHYIDVLPVMRDKDGNVRKELFGPDNLHMNPQGYRLWTPILKRALG